MTREEDIEKTRRMVRLLEQRRLKEFAELFAEDAKWIHPFHSGLFPAETVGREEIYNAVKTAADNFDDIKFPIEEILPFEDSNKIAMKHTGNLILKNGRGTYENDYLTILSFDENGKISEWIEYYNPITAAKGFGLMDKIR